MPLDYTLASVDRNGEIPITRQIVNLVLKNIEMLALEPGERLPTERELASCLGVARGTVQSAYRQLEKINMVRTRQGSGTYVSRDEELANKARKEKAVGILSATIASLTSMGLVTQEISRLFDACIAQEHREVVEIAVISAAPEQLLDLKRQLSFLQGVRVSLFILESITENQDPQALLRNFHIVLIPEVHYKALSALLPNLRRRLVEAVIVPGGETMSNLTALSRKARIGIICRSNAFLAIVKECLRTLGFAESNILSFFEMDYTTETYFPGGIDVLVSFHEAHIFTNPAFGFRNEEFWAKGGKILSFRHQLERGAFINIEEQVRGWHGVEEMSVSEDSNE